MAKILFSPERFILGSGELARLGSYAEKYGKKALVLISASGQKRVGARIENSFKEHQLELIFDAFNGECSTHEIERLKTLVESQNLDMVIGVGGGKILDTAKAVAYFCGTPVLICPTIASSDAPCSALSVIYSDEGVFEKYLFLKSNPNVVLMDTAVIAESPLRLTIAGMGDALATYFEARACNASDAGTCAGGKSTLASTALAKLCYDTLLADGLQAKIALEAKAVTAPVERIIEANTLLSGIGFESCGLAGAHAVHNGLTVLPETHALYHGEKVAFGTLVQLVLEGASSEELDTVYDFCLSVGLPVTLAELGVKTLDPDKLMAVAKLAAAEGETIHNMPFEVTAEKVYNAILGADALGRYYSAL